MKTTAIFSILVALLLVAGAVVAANGLDIPRQLIGGGGGSVQQDAFVLHGSIGQAVVGRVQSLGYGLSSGFWGGGALNRIYLPLVLKNQP
jgi:putative copper export protein